MRKLCGCHQGRCSYTSPKCSLLQKGDSQMAVLALGSLTARSKLDKEYMTSLATATSFLHIRRERVGYLMSSCILAMNLWTSSEFSRRWSISRTCATASFFRPKLCRKKTSELFALSKVDLAAFVDGLTRHCAIGTLPKLYGGR